jgi:hypothetical protein
LPREGLPFLDLSGGGRVLPLLSFLVSVCPWTVLVAIPNQHTASKRLQRSPLAEGVA